MRVDVKNAGPCRKELRLEIPEERVSEEYNRTVAAYSKQAKIPGFRPGKAPSDLVKRRFKKEIEEDVREHLIPWGYHEAIKQKEMDVVTVLGVRDVVYEIGKPMSFVVTLDVPPEFKLPKYKGISVAGKKVEVTADEVKKTIGNILDQFAEYKDANDREVREDDLVQIDYEATSGGKPLEDLSPKAEGLGKAEDFWTVANEEYGFIPGLAKGLLGLKVDEEKDVDVKFDKKFVEAALAGKKAVYHVKVKAIREKLQPELNEEILKKLGVESEDKLKQQVTTDLQRMHEDRELGRRKNEILGHLLKKASFDLPESVVQDETRQAIYEIVRRHSAQGIPQDVIEEKKDEIFANAEGSAKEKVKLRYILHRIAEEEKLAVAEEDVYRHVAAMAARYGMDPRTMFSELEKRNEIDNVKEDVRMQKTVDFLLEQADVKE